MTALHFLILRLFINSIICHIYYLGSLFMPARPRSVDYYKKSAFHENFNAEHIQLKLSSDIAILGVTYYRIRDSAETSLSNALP